MEISADLILLAFSVILFLQLRNQQPYSSTPPQSSQPFTPLAGGTRKKRRKARRKQKDLNGINKVVAIPEEKVVDLPLYRLSGGLKQRITEQYFEGFCRAKVDMICF